MASNVKSHGKNLVGSRVQFLWPKDNSLCEGVVSSHGRSGENLVIYTNGVEDILNLKKDHKEPIGYVFADQVKEPCDPAHSSSDMLPEGVSGMTDYGEDLVGCKVKVWRSKSKTSYEGVVSSYDLSRKKHLVVYTNGMEEMLNLRKHREPAEDISPDQAQKVHAPAHASHSMSSDNDMDAHWHGRKRRKDLSFDLMTSRPSPKKSKYEISQTSEVGISSRDPQLPIIPGDDGLVNVNGYKMKATTAATLEAIFAKYGDITAHCLYRSTSVTASMLEVICTVVQKLQYYDLEAILSNLEVIEDEISDVEASKIDVSWIHEHLAKVRLYAACSDKSLQLKKTRVKSGLVTKAAAKEMKQRHEELLLAQERFKEAEKRVNAMRIVSRKIKEDMLESESEEHYWKRRLDDLL